MSTASSHACHPCWRACSPAAPSPRKRLPGGQGWLDSLPISWWGVSRRTHARSRMLVEAPQVLEGLLCAHPGRAGHFVASQSADCPWGCGCHTCSPTSALLSWSLTRRSTALEPQAHWPCGLSPHPCPGALGISPSPSQHELKGPWPSQEDLAGFRGQPQCCQVQVTSPPNLECGEGRWC